MTTIRDKIASLEEVVQNLDLEIAHLREQRAAAMGKLEAYRDAESLMPMPSQSSKTRTGGGQRKPRALSGHWKKILGEMAEHYPMRFDYDTIEKIVRWAGHEADKRTLRSQMSLYKERGLVSGDAEEGFQVTEAGAGAAGTVLGKQRNQNEAGPGAFAPGPDPDLGPVGRERGYPPSAPEGSTPSGSTASQSLGDILGEKIRERNLDDETPF